ncbi:MAG: hypothetical protein ACPGLV_19170, partial [Bacteroidia bacterium]
MARFLWIVIFTLVFAVNSVLCNERDSLIANIKSLENDEDYLKELFSISNLSLQFNTDTAWYWAQKLKTKAVEKDVTYWAAKADHICAIV